VKRLAALLLALLPLAAGEAQADGKETLEAARAAYYSLGREGLAGFTCLVTPNWDGILASQRHANPAAAEKAYKVLSGLTFGIEVAPGQHAKVMHAGAPTSAGEKEAESLKIAAAGIERSLAGFFDTWAPFVMTSTIPPASADVVEAHGTWNVDYREGPVQIDIVMRKDYVIDVMHVVTAKVDSVLQPQFVRTAKGLLLTAVQGEYRPTAGGNTSTLQVRIEYQVVDGFQLPRRVWISARDQRGVVLMDLGFGTCQAQRRK
jgi:hypothetical protein